MRDNERKSEKVLAGDKEESSNEESDEAMSVGTDVTPSKQPEVGAFAEVVSSINIIYLAFIQHVYCRLPSSLILMLSYGQPARTKA